MRLPDNSAVRVHNLTKVLDLLKSGPMTRHRLMELTGLSLMSVTNLTNQLLAFDAVELQQAENAGRHAGRKAELVSLKSSEPVWLVLDLRKRRPSLVLFSAAEVRTAEKACEARGDYEEDLKAFLHMAARETRGCSLRGAAAIAPGPYSFQTDRVTNMRIPRLNSIPIREVITDTLGVDCRIDEDVKLSAGACAKANPDAKSLYYLYIGEGVGGALVSDGALLTGLNSLAGDPGQLHMGKTTFEELLKQDTFMLELQHTEAAALAEKTARIAAELLEIVIWMTDPHMIVIDCTYIHLLPPGFCDMVRKYLSERLVLRILPEITISSLPEEPAFLGAVRIIEQQWLTAAVRNNQSEQ